MVDPSIHGSIHACDGRIAWLHVHMALGRMRLGRYVRHASPNHPHSTFQPTLGTPHLTINIQKAFYIVSMVTFRKESVPKAETWPDLLRRPQLCVKRTLRH